MIPDGDEMWENTQKEKKAAVSRKLSYFNFILCIFFSENVIFVNNIPISFFDWLLEFLFFCRKFYTFVLLCVHL